MRVSNLLRWPGTGFPDILETGDAELDDYLRVLDRHCLGSRSVRRQYVEEIRDNMLEARDQAVKAGQTVEAANASVVADFGPAEELARVQRQQRWRNFRRGAVTMGLSFALLMLLFQLLAGGLADPGPLVLAEMFVFHGLFFGFFMGFWFAFMFAPAAPEGGVSAQSQMDKADGYEVYSPGLSKVLAILLGLVMLILGGMTVAGMLGRGLMADVGVAANLLLTVLALHVAFGLRVAFTRIQVDGDSIRIRTLLREYYLDRDSISKFEELGRLQQAIYPMAGKTYQLHWQDEKGSHALYLGLNGEMVNGDRLRVLLRPE